MQEIDLNKYLNPKQPIIIAVSGGADSVCLAHLLFKSNKYKIVLAHFNHHVREESDEDEKLVKDFAKKLDLPIEIGHWKKPEKSEAAARKARYTFLREIQKKHNAQSICLGHHQDDQVETILFNFLRGTGASGLAGMPFFENEILRPLLYTTKEEILDYCQKNQLKFCFDQTNLDTTYARNKLRLEILPELQKINPNLGKTLLQNAEIYRELSELLKTQIQPFLNKHTIEIKDFLSLPKAVQTELIKQKIKDHTEPSFKKIEEIMRIIHGGVGNKFKQFDKIRVSVGAGRITFKKIKE